MGESLSEEIRVCFAFGNSGVLHLRLVCVRVCRKMGGGH